MKLTPSEIKMLANLRKQQAQWPTVRWLQLIIGLGTAIAFACLYVRLSSFMKNDPMLGLAAFAVLSPVLILWVIFGGYKAGQAIMEWRGNPEKTLLLKLIEDVDKKGSQESASEGTDDGSQARRT
jgi:hypothetical protein